MFLLICTSPKIFKENEEYHFALATPSEDVNNGRYFEFTFTMLLFQRGDYSYAIQYFVAT